MGVNPRADCKNHTHMLPIHGSALKARRRARGKSLRPLPMALLTLLACCSFAEAQDSRISTPADRNALVDYLIKKTFEREAFSTIKNKTLGLDIREAMEACRKEIVEADSQTELFYGLLKLSNARCDRHLKISSFKNGPSPRQDFRDVLDDDIDKLTRPIQLDTGFSDPAHPTIFVTNKAASVSTRRVNIGDRVVGANGMTLAEFAAFAKPYSRFSTVANFWKRLPEMLSEPTTDLPPSFYKYDLKLKLRKSSGREYEVELPLLEASDLRWSRSTVIRYPGFKRVTFDESFETWVPSKKDGPKVLVLCWYGFRDDLKNAIDHLIELAEKNNWLDHDLIIDFTKSRGGSLGAYAIQRLSPQPFRTTFGNLRISDITRDFVDDKLEDIREDKLKDSGGPEAVDDGTNLADWLTTDVEETIRKQAAYSNNVPFKCAHLPRTSNGILRPADVHFRGRMVCWFGPYGGSHLDQFAAMVIDNKLAWTIGMPTGGYSNTWEYEEDVKFPISRKPAIEFMWSIGHTVRPNGEVLEGNPPMVDEFFPMTHENFREYRELLLKKSLEYLKIEISSRE